MAEENVPGLGKMPKWAVYATLAGGAVIVFYVWRHKSSGSSATPVAGSTDTGGIDPTTGYPYGSAQDQAALAGSIPSADISGQSAGFPVGDGTSTTVNGSSSPTTNAAWSQAVENTLSTIGYDPLTVANAVGAYLARQDLTSAQASLIRVAIAEVGTPPVGGPYPIKVAQPPGGGTHHGGGTGGGTHTGTPKVTNGHVISVSNNDAAIGWTGTGASSWRVTLHGPGKENGRATVVNHNSATYSGLEAGHTYDVTVQPLVHGKPEGTPGTITFTTKPPFTIGPLKK